MSETQQETTAEERTMLDEIRKVLSEAEQERFYLLRSIARRRVHERDPIWYAAWTLTTCEHCKCPYVTLKHNLRKAQRCGWMVVRLCPHCQLGPGCPENDDPNVICEEAVTTESGRVIYPCTEKPALFINATIYCKTHGALHEDEGVATAVEKEIAELVAWFREQPGGAATFQAIDEHLAEVGAMFAGHTERWYVIRANTLDVLNVDDEREIIAVTPAAAP